MAFQRLLAKHQRPHIMDHVILYSEKFSSYNFGGGGVESVIPLKYGPGPWSRGKLATMNLVPVHGPTSGRSFRRWASCRLVDIQCPVATDVIFQSVHGDNAVHRITSCRLRTRAVWRRIFLFKINEAKGGKRHLHATQLGYFTVYN